VLNICRFLQWRAITNIGRYLTWYKRYYYYYYYYY